MSRKVKVAIIGAGSGGLSAAGEVRKHTDDFVIINEGHYGTTCARVGCMPSKVLIHVANDFHRRGVYEQTGIRGGEGLSIDSRQVMEHVRTLRDRFVRGVMGGISGDKAHNLEGRAVFCGPNTLKVEEETIEADKIIIATGSTPVVPAPWRDLGVLTSDDIFELESLPRSVAVVGLGVIGLELGMAMNRLGVRVIGINRGQSLPLISDAKINEYAKSKIAQEMDAVWGEEAEIEKTSDGYQVKFGSRVETVDEVFCSLGRRPNVSGLMLEKAGIDTDDFGIPRFDPNTMQVGDLPVFIAGDVTNERTILHEASDEGRIAGFNAASGEVACFRRRANLGICFTEPNICCSGASYEEIKSKNPLIGEVSFEGQGRSLSMVKAKGHLRVYACRDSAKILGAEMYAPHGEHLAHMLSWVIQQGLDVFQVLRLPFYHPVVAEGLRTALREIAEQCSEGHSKLELAGCNETSLDALCSIFWVT